MTDAIYVRCLPHFEVPPGPAAVANPSPASSAEPALDAKRPEPADVVCRTARIRVNFGRLLADLNAEARRLLGGAICD